MSLDNNYAASIGYDRHEPTPVTRPDSPSHLDKIRDEVIQQPQKPVRFHGLDIGIAQLGFQSNGSLRVHLNLGIVDAGANVGLQNGADGGVHLGQIIDGHVGGGVGVDENGFHGNVGGHARAIGLVGAGGEVNARLGDATGADVAAGANVGRIRAGGGVGAGLGDDGLDAALTARARAGRLAGVHGGAHLGLNDDSELAAAVGGNLGDARGTLAAGAYSDLGTTFRPDAILTGSIGRRQDSVLDLNPPIGYPDELPPPIAAPPTPAGIGSLRDNPIESKPLPPAHEAATPENLARVNREILTKLSNENKYTVQKGDSYESIAAKLNPGADTAHLAKAAEKLQKMNEANGYKGLHKGLVLNTDDPYSIERKTRKLVAEHFGFATPSS